MIKKILFFSIVLGFISCGKTLLSFVQPKNINKSLKIIQRDNDTIIFLPMVHIANPNFYNKAKSIIDSLRNEKYIIFYESITFQEKYLKENLDSLTKEELFIKIRKFRKMLGRFQMNDLTSEKNKSLPSYYKNKKFISQSNTLLGIDSTDINADVTMTMLIEAQEKKYGKIILSDCDFKTEFNEKYKCDKVTSYYSINTFRDSIASNIMMKSRNKKSLLVYGKGHWYGIWPFFRNSGYKQIK